MNYKRIIEYGLDEEFCSRQLFEEMLEVGLRYQELRGNLSSSNNRIEEAIDQIFKLSSNDLLTLFDTQIDGVSFHELFAVLPLLQVFERTYAAYRFSVESPEEKNSSVDVLIRLTSVHDMGTIEIPIQVKQDVEFTKTLTRVGMEGFDVAKVQEILKIYSELVLVYSRRVGELQKKTIGDLRFEPKLWYVGPVGAPVEFTTENSSGKLLFSVGELNYFLSHEDDVHMASFSLPKAYSYLR